MILRPVPNGGAVTVFFRFPEIFGDWICLRPGERAGPRCCRRDFFPDEDVRPVGGRCRILNSEGPVPGYLLLPRNAAPKLPGTKVIFLGCGAAGAEIPWRSADRKTLPFQTKVHGDPNGLSPAEYKKLGAGKFFGGKSNESRETACSREMIRRAIRAVEYVQAPPEWNRSVLKVEGGSPGGNPAIVAAGLLPDQGNDCHVFIPWRLDPGGVTIGRPGSWRPDYTPHSREEKIILISPSASRRKSFWSDSFRRRCSSVPECSNTALFPSFPASAAGGRKRSNRTVVAKTGWISIFTGKGAEADHTEGNAPIPCKIPAMPTPATSSTILPSSSKV